jgi:hypothetical protein
VGPAGEWLCDTADVTTLLLSWHYFYTSYEFLLKKEEERNIFVGRKQLLSVDNWDSIFVLTQRTG